MNPLFIHLPKTGGTTVRESLPLRRNTQSQFSGPTPEGVWSFAFIRNPWDRILSWYFYTLRKQLSRRAGDEQLSELQERASLDFSRWVCAGGLEQISTAQSVIEGVDTIYRFENLEAALRDIAQRLEVPLTATIPHANRSPLKGHHGRELYTPEAAERVSVHSSWEIDRFNYTLEGPT